MTRASRAYGKRKVWPCRKLLILGALLTAIVVSPAVLQAIGGAVQHAVAESWLYQFEANP